MAKVDPYSLKLKPRVAFEREFVDPMNPGVVVKLSLRRLGSMERIAVMNMAENKIVEYVTGLGVPGSKDYSPPMLLPPIDGQAVIVSEGAARVAAFVCRAQTSPPADRYTWEELVAFMACDAFCEGFANLVPEIAPDDEEETPDPLASTTPGKE